MIPILFIGLGLVLLVVGIIIYGRWNYGELEKMGIPLEKPTFLFGSCPDFYKKNPQLEDIRRFKKFGSVFGMYEGRAPQIFIADPELLKLILVKDYEHFSSRASIDLGHPISNELLDYLPDDRWKAVRQMLTPELTSSRIKQTMRSTSRIADEFAQDLRFEMGECDRIKFDLRNRIIAVLIDITAAGLFNLELQNRRDPNNSFVLLLRNILCEHVQYDFRYTLLLQFPILSYIFPQCPFPTESLDSFRGFMINYLKTRRQQGNFKRNDVGDVFVDMMDQVASPEFKKLGITEATAISQVLEIFFAAYDSTGTALSMCIYHLAHNPEIQDRVIEEVDQVFEKYGRLEDPVDGQGSQYQVLPYEGLGELVYLTACINEALRLSPSFIRPERKCTKDWTATSKDSGIQITIKKGQNVLIPIWALHRHPDYFPDPEVFDPERFMPENKDRLHTYSFVPFGHGMKNCIGMTLAYTNMKTVIARLLKEFRLEIRPDTQLEYKKGTRFVVQYKPIYLDLVKRS